MKNTRMKPEAIAMAAQCLTLTITDLRAALEDANTANEQFAWLLLESALQDAVALRRKVTSIMGAASQ